MKDETKAWLTKAHEDFRAAKILFDSGLSDTTCYHCQQTAEKCIKGLLEESGARIPRTHDLDSLIEQLPSTGNIPEEVKAFVVRP